MVGTVGCRTGRSTGVRTVSGTHRLDLAFAVPLLDTTRARDRLAWTPSVPADAALAEVVGGMADAVAGPGRCCVHAGRSRM